MKSFVFNKRFMIGFPSESPTLDIIHIKIILSNSIDSFNHNNWQFDSYDGDEESIGYKVFGNGLEAVAYALEQLKKENLICA